ncbi:beta-glucosidase [Asaia prunellae]|uniref:beta-glucosidase n=1 Tax=Asaia prunellae TaxID=610245 RepID=UPI000471503D|nr:glycoside hydrolase family 3 C-terminal domain-containing protein [Asaia prunellae]
MSSTYPVRKKHLVLAIGMAAFLTGSLAVAAPAPWQDRSASTQDRVAALMQRMTKAEKLSLVTSELAMEFGNYKKPAGAIGSAAYVAAIGRLGVPALQISDAGLGVTNPVNARPGDGATALPAGQAQSGAFDLQLAREGGAMIGAEAKHRGFNVLLAGGMDLVRDPRNGRNFEYMGEDPILAGQIAAAEVAGVQSQHVISTIKHYAVNSYETGRMMSSMDMSVPAMQESDLLAFRIAVEEGKPGSIMCSYNKVNAVYACQNPYLLTDVLRGEWGYDGFVMSDWGALSDGAAAVTAGLDQDSASTLDRGPKFIDAMRKMANRPEGEKVLDTKVRHILTAMIANGVFDDQARPAEGDAEIAAHMAVARRIEEEGAVLLRNENATLPLASVKKILVVGGHADKGVIAGGGSSAVLPRGGSAVIDPVQPSLETMPHPIVFEPNPPLDALRKAMPGAKIVFNSGENPREVAELAQKADAVVVFVTKWQGESLDAPDLELTEADNALIEAVAQANRKSVVVLETGNPVVMPWFGKVGAVLEAWYPGSAGGEAIANLLSGKVAPSGRLTTTWPKALTDLPRPELPGAGHHAGAFPFDKSNIAYLKNYDLNIEGANVGYRWFAERKIAPAFPFGFGLSYTQFSHDGLTVSMSGKTAVAHAKVTNTGKRVGDDIVQIYAHAPDGTPLRLAGYGRVTLAPGESRIVDVPLSPYATARYDVAQKNWKQSAGTYRFVFAQNAADQTGPSASLSIDAE